MSNGVWKRVAALFMALALVVAFDVSPAFAAGKKTVRTQGFTTSTSVAKRKATRVTRGTTRLTIKGGKGYMKFKAPKTKTYTFTMSNMKSNRFSASGYWYIMKSYGSGGRYIGQVPVRTQGGRTTAMWMGVNGRNPGSTGKKIYRTLAKRSAKIKLKKGEEVYIYVYNGGGGKTTATLSIR